MKRLRFYVLPLFFLSGASGLVYEVLWVRMFANAFGSGVFSAAAVTAVFMAGLGAGALIAGFFADRRSAVDPVGPLRLYAALEVAIGLSALAVVFSLPRLEAVSGAISSYVVDDDGWYVLAWRTQALRFAAAAVLLLPATTLLGATLPLLVRFLLAEGVEGAGLGVGLLYAFNTAGASLGCFAADFALVPVFGLTGASAVAALGNLTAGLCALRLAAAATRDEARGPQSGATVAPREEERSVDGSVRLITCVAAAAFFAGVAGMGMEIVWFRFLSSTLGGFRAVFSLLLAVILVGIWIGAVLAGYLDRRFRRPVLWWGLAAAGFVAAALAALVGFDPEIKRLAHVASDDPAVSDNAKAFALSLRRLAVVAVVAGVPAVFAGFTYPLANAVVQRRRAAVGRRAGLLYLANTLGGVIGSLATGFLLIPALGTQGSVAALCAAAAAVPVSLLFAVGRAEDGLGRRFGTRVALALAAAGVLAAMAAWAALPRDYLALKAFTAKERALHILALSEGVDDTIAVVQTDPLHRALFTNGHMMSGTHAGAARYMRAFAHLPLLQLDDPRRVLVICFGVGNTLHAASLHPSVTRLETVDLSRDVLAHARYFIAANRNVLEAPRTAVFVNDGRQHLRMSKDETLDLITLEPPPLAFAGVFALYSEDFYALARGKLRKGGFITQWLPAYQVQGDTVLSVIRAFIDVFPEAVMLSGSERQLILMGRKGVAIEIDPGAVSRKIAANAALRDDLRAIQMGSLTEIVGTFAADHETLAKAAARSIPVTDDNPLLEHDATAALVRTVIPKEIFDTSRAARFCPGCFSGSRPIPALRGLDTYLAMLGAWYASDAFRSSRVALTEAEQRIRFGLPPKDMIPALRASGYLRRVFPGFLEKLEAGGRP